MRKILITGSRDIFPEKQIRKDLESLTNYGTMHLVVIHGGASGVDETADQVAKSMGIHTVRVDALWNTFHKAAGPIRNRMMLALEPDECLAYSNDFEESKGTQNMIEQCRKAGIPVTLRETNEITL